jgi:hypothetical protein
MMGAPVSVDVARSFGFGIVVTVMGLFTFQVSAGIAWVAVPRHFGVLASVSLTGGAPGCSRHIQNGNAMPLTLRQMDRSDLFWALPGLARSLREQPVCCMKSSNQRIVDATRTAGSALDLEVPPPKSGQENPSM